jgi:hypothetical protein
MKTRIELEDTICGQRQKATQGVNLLWLGGNAQDLKEKGAYEW